MNKAVYKFGFPRLFKFIIYCSLIAIVGFVSYFFRGDTDLSDPARYNDGYSVSIEEEYEDMFHLVTD
ncbi:MAG: hypothetical protein AMS27_10560 [Bacteroides sp. SM23_62_1]|nr:MAG: hypothetical protein AMS27_10560 [Bacteroides sp. SM23_62_1]